MDVPSLCSCSPRQPGWGGPARSSQGAGGTRPLSHPEQAAGLGGLGCCGQASLRDVQEGMRKWQDWRGLQGLKITRGDAVRPPGPAGAVLTSCPSPETPPCAWGSARLLGRCCLLPGGVGRKACVIPHWALLGSVTSQDRHGSETSALPARAAALWGHVGLTAPGAGVPQAALGCRLLGGAGNRGGCALASILLLSLLQIFGDYYHFRHRGVVKRSLSPHQPWHSRLAREPQVGAAWRPAAGQGGSDHRALAAAQGPGTLTWCPEPCTMGAWPGGCRAPAAQQSSVPCPACSAGAGPWWRGWHSGRGGREELGPAGPWDAVAAMRGGAGGSLEGTGGRRAGRSCGSPMTSCPRCTGWSSRWQSAGPSETFSWSPPTPSSPSSGTW